MSVGGEVCYVPDDCACSSCTIVNLAARVSELEDTIRLRSVEADISFSYGRNAEAGRIEAEIRSRRGDDWPGATVVVYPSVSPKRQETNDE